MERENKERQSHSEILQSKLDKSESEIGMLQGSVQQAGDLQSNCDKLQARISGKYIHTLIYILVDAQLGCVQNKLFASIWLEAIHVHKRIKAFNFWLGMQCVWSVIVHNIN